MQNLLKIAAGFCIFFLLFYACDYACGKASSSLRLVSFTEAESDTVILRRFVKGKDFSTLLDTFLLSGENSNFQRQGDTLTVLHNVDDYFDITSEYDYQIYLPGAERLYMLSDIKEDYQNGSNSGCNKTYCINGFQSYKVDGQLVENIDYDFVYLRK